MCSDWLDGRQGHRWRTLTTTSGSAPALLRPADQPWFRIVDVVEQSSDWLIWRNDGIGASDAPIIMGESVFGSRRRLLYRKRTPALEYPDPARHNRSLQRGLEREPAARTAYEQAISESMPARCVQSTAIPWLRASLDGLSADGQRVVEIKCGDGTYRSVQKSGKPPKGYYGQLQHILAVTGLDIVDLWVWVPHNQPVLVQVPRDNTYIEQMLEREARFWAEVNSPL